MTISKNFIISSQSIYQTKFWYHVALKLNKQNNNTLIVCFDFESEKFLSKKRNINYISIKSKNKLKNSQVIKILNKYQIKNLKKLLLHEKIYFGDRNYKKIKLKFCNYLSEIDSKISNINKKKSVLIQELGGFSSTLSLFYFAKKNKINNYFIEPSFFSGRFHINANTFLCKPEINKNVNYNKFLKELKKIRNKKRILIPKKDFEQFQSPFKKIFNLKNQKRFLEKFFKVYFLRKSFEFNEVNRYAFSHLKNLLNYFILSFFYKKNLENEKFYYFPLHVPNDVALSIRAPKYLDQIKLISKISKKINNDKILFIKEHPAKIGATNILKLIKILKKKNIKILHPKVNTFDIIKRADSVITINSKTGFETILFNKPLNVFGESYYKNLNKVNYLDDKKIQLEFYKVLNNKESNNFF